MWSAQVRGFSLVLVLAALASARSSDEEEAKQWLEQINQDFMNEMYLYNIASWNYNTNLTDANLEAELAAAERLAIFRNEMYDASSKFAWEDFSEPVRRQFSKIRDIGSAVLSTEELSRLNELTAEMQRMYSVAKVCDRPGDKTGTCYPLDPDLTHIMATSRDWEELKWAWKGWRDESSRETGMREAYRESVSLLNTAAKENGYADNGDYWRSWYDTPTFEEDCAKLWKTVKPLYEQLHAYVRRKLQALYSDHDFPTSGHIPAHLLGDMWAQQWNPIVDVVQPYPEKPIFDVTDELVNQGYDPLRMFELSEEFFTSLGLLAMPEEFWDHTMMVKPSDREVVCHASAWDFYNQKDFRIKQCTEVTHDWLITTHHEMGHIQYFLQYKDQPVWYRDGANPGFHEAIGDVMSLSVSTPEHLYKIGLLPDFTDDKEVDINFLMGQALQKIAFLPFGYLIDQWRWRIFDNHTSPDSYNKAWWELRCRHQGLVPPVPRSEEDFDAGAKYHVPAGVPYIRYFVSFIVQFQFHKALCDGMGYEGPLHRCDIYRSREAGSLIGDMMKLGSELPWPDAMEAIAGSREMDAGPLVEYFKPLLDWLQDQNDGFPVGWHDQCP